MNEKTKFALYLDEATKREVAQLYTTDGSRSQTEFVEKALKFYLDYIKLSHMGQLLPTELKSYLDGRVGTLENRMASLLFKMAVEQNSIMRLLAERLGVTVDEISDLRCDSVKDVKRTNGRLTFAQIAEELEVQ